MAVKKKAAAKKPAAKKTATKKTTTKPAAKKTTTTKKTTTAKPVTKKTTTTKTTTKPAAKTTTKSAVEISVTGNKKIDTLRKEFNKQFPYLRLSLYYSYMRNESTKTPLSGDKTLASVRRADSGGDISIAGNKKIKTLEKAFNSVVDERTKLELQIKDLNTEIDNLSKNK
jgi:cell division protein FtsB